MERGTKWNTAKAKLSLVDPLFIETVARVLATGEERYGRGNWKKGIPVSEILDAIKRHTAAIESGEEIDPDTGEPHAAAIACNSMFLDWYRRQGLLEKLDDRHHKTQMLRMREDSSRDGVLSEQAGEEGSHLQAVRGPGEEPGETGGEAEIPKTAVESLQQRIKVWADKVYPYRTPEVALNKMMTEELPELLNGGLDDPLEWADVLILLLDVASLRGINAIAAAHAKMTINEKRKWDIDDRTGIMKHVSGDEPIIAWRLAQESENV